MVPRVAGSIPVIRPLLGDFMETRYHFRAVKDGKIEIEILTPNLEEVTKEMERLIVEGYKTQITPYYIER